MTEEAIRASSHRMSRGLFLVFGIIVGLVAGLLVVIERPPEVIEEELVALEGSQGPGASTEDVDQGEDGPSVRFETRGGSQGTEGETSGGGNVTEGASEQQVTNPKDYKCAPGANGGATDAGVNGNSIKVAANIVLEGPGASFLDEAIIGIEAVIDEANVQGICGRKLVLTKRNDAWDAPTGLQYIENYIDDDHFALMVNPSSEGLDLAVQNGTIDRAGIPVVGTDGMLISQYRWPEDSGDPGLSKWVWPVAASTVSTMHIMTQHALDLASGSAASQKYALVFDNEYKFGVEGARAFKNHLRSLGVPEGQIFTKGIEPGKGLYTDEANDFNGECGTDDNPRCFLVAMLLDPKTAITWIKAGATFGSDITAGPQTLFNRSFAVQCVDERKKLPGSPGCDLIVWTGYNPPVGALANLPDVAKYVSDVKARNATADVENSFTQGAYLGASVFVEALKKVGPNLTAENLSAVLDSMTYESDLTKEPLSWTPRSHFANTTMHAFRVGFTPNGFSGWQSENVEDTDDRVGEI